MSRYYNGFDLENTAERGDILRFPKFLTAEMLTEFRTTPRGSTHPRVGWIGGHKYIAKCGTWSLYSSDGHVRNELIADEFLRNAGLNAPESRGYIVDFHDGDGPQVVRLALFQEYTFPILEVWNEAGIEMRKILRSQVGAAYPVLSFIAAHDSVAWDNIRVRPNGGLVFVDNGSSFDYRAKGQKKLWFWKRTDPHDLQNGYMSLYRHPNQKIIREILGDKAEKILWCLAAKYQFAKLVASLPEDYRRIGLLEYASALDNAVREVITL